jgi:hypothetical protein
MPPGLPRRRRLAGSWQHCRAAQQGSVLALLFQLLLRGLVFSLLLLLLLLLLVGA